jgi:hypothetical protein
VALARWGASDEVLYRHFVAGADAARAVVYAQRAADAAMRALAFDRAASLYRAALEGGPDDADRRRALLVSLGQSLIHAGRSREAAESFTEAAGAGAPSEDVRLDLLRRAAEQFLVSGHLGEGIATLRLVLRGFGFWLPATRWAALARLGWFRLRLSRRPLRWVARRSDVPASAAAARVDLCWSVGSGLGLVDSVRSVLFFDHGALLALDDGDEDRIARALSAAAVAEAGLGRREQAARLGEACRRAAEGAGSNRARFYEKVATFSYRFFLENDWRGCIEGTREAQSLWRAEGRTEGWENDVAEQFACWSLDNMGHLRELRARVPARILAAQRAGNRLIDVNFRTQFVNLHLADDRPEEARRDVMDAIASWPRVDGEFANQDYLALRNLTYVAIYEGNVDEVARRAPEWRRYFSSLLSRIAFLHQDALYWIGASALLQARSAPVSEREGFLRSAERAARRLGGFDLPMAAAYAQHLRAGVAACRNQEAVLHEALARALSLAETQGAELHAACIRWRLSELLGGDERGHGASARGWMQSQGVRAPERLVAALLPGVAGSSSAHGA